MEVRPYLIIGSGRLASHLQHYFQLLSIPFYTWSRRSPLALENLLPFTKTVLLLISDRALAEFFESHLKDQFSGPVFHMSGALVVPGMTWVHPLMTFGDELEDINFYQRLAFAEPQTGVFRQNFPELMNSSFVISDELKPRYHAWAVMGGNLISLLAIEALKEFEKLEVPNLNAKFYLEKSFANALAQGRLALTGPLIRGDQVTIRKNLDALDESQRKLYSAFVEKFAPEVNL